MMDCEYSDVTIQKQKHLNVLGNVIVYVSNIYFNILYSIKESIVKYFFAVRKNCLFDIVVFLLLSVECFISF